ncbi:MAG: hypothetical protein WB630_16475 [Candidatus Acidiferrales bacterium]
MSLRTDANGPHPKTLRILIILVQIELSAPQKTDEAGTRQPIMLRPFGSRAPSGPPCHRSAMCAIADLIRQSLVESEIQIPEIPERSTGHI